MEEIGRDGTNQCFISEIENETERNLWQELVNHRMISLSDSEIRKAREYLWFYSLQENKDKEKSYSNSGREINKEIKDVKRQIITYDKLIHNSRNAVEELINLTNGEIDRQYARKTQFENRAGLFLATWGILLGVIVNERYELECTFFTATWKIILLAFFGVLSIIFVCLTLSPAVMKAFDFKDKENNYYSASEDREVFFVAVLEGLTNVYISNEKVLNRKTIFYKCSIVTTVIWAFTITLGLLH